MTNSKLELVRWEDYKEGDSASHSKTVTEADVILFAGISGDFNPLHINENFAQTTMFKKRIVPGIFSASLISASLSVKLFGPGILYLSQSLDFRHPVFIGDTLTAVATVKEKFTKKNGALKYIRLDTKVYNQEHVLVTDGEASVLVM